MAAEKKKPVMDVSKPGKSPADATTRPIITGHSIMKDPMVTEETKPVEGVTPEEPEAEKIAIPVSTHRVIQPISSTDELPAEKPVTPNNAQAEESAEEPEPENTDEPPAEEPAKKAEPSVSDDAVVDAVLDQVGDKKEETKESEEERKRQELVDKLVEEKKYFVPIAQERSRRNNRLAVIIIGALLPVIVGLGLAADAGVINLGFKVPFDFIKDKSVATVPAPVVTQPAVTETKPKLTEFNNKDLGVVFSYPEEWGTTTVKDNSAEKTEKGKRSLVTFSAQPKVTVGLMQATWKDTSTTDVKRICNQPGFTVYKPVTTDLNNGRFVATSQDAYQVYEELTGGLCNDIQLTGNVKFTKNTVYTGMSLVYQDKVADSFDLAQRIADWQKSKTKYFPKSLTDQFTALITSVKEQ